MKFSHPNCPECGEKARGACDWVPGLALFDHFEDGEVEYAGDTEVFWDGQVNEVDLIEGDQLPFGGTIPEGVTVSKENRDRIMVVECYNGDRWVTGLQ